MKNKLKLMGRIIYVISVLLGVIYFALRYNTDVLSFLDLKQNIAFFALGMNAFGSLVLLFDAFIHDSNESKML